jgi:AhpD family alkylhydroperoxidase
MGDSPYPAIGAETAKRRRELAGETFQAFHAFSKQVFAEGALPVKTKQLIALAVAHVTQCPYCIEGHAKLAVQNGASDEEMMEAIWVAAEMRAGGAYAHAGLALEAVKAARGQASS